MDVLKVAQGFAVVELSETDLKLLKQVYGSRYTNLGRIAGANETKYAALQAQGAAFTALDAAVKNAPDEDEEDVVAVATAIAGGLDDASGLAGSELGPTLDDLLDDFGKLL